MAARLPFDTWLSAQGGVAHTSAARAAGFTGAELTACVRGGAATRVRRSWLVGPSATPERAAAASVGGRLTCVSAAQERGLWVPPHDLVHVGVAATSGRLEADGLRLHWSAGPAPVVRGAVTDHPLNVLFHVAQCLQLEHAAAVWESAIRQGVVEAAHLPRVMWRSAAAAQLARESSSLSDSGLETRFVRLMRECGVAVAQQVWVDDHPLDGLIGECLAIQIDGFAHHQAADRRRDIAADARLALLGYTVLRFDYRQILFEPDAVRATVIAAMAQGLHLRRR